MEKKEFVVLISCTMPKKIYVGIFSVFRLYWHVVYISPDVISKQAFEKSESVNNRMLRDLSDSIAVSLEPTPI